MDKRFESRSDAGRALAGLLGHYAGRDDVLVLALPRGGVPVGHEIAKSLGCDLDVLVVRKLGLPGYPELAMGAIASGGASYLDPRIIEMAGVQDAQIKEIFDVERAELARRESVYRGGRRAPGVQRLTAIVVDDGVATGASMLAALQALAANRPARVVVATPVAPPQALEHIEAVADEVVCVMKPKIFHGVGQFYKAFPQTTDDEVRAILDCYNKALP